MPQDAFQVDPVINDKGDIVGVEAHSLNHEGMGRDGRTVGWENDLYEDQFGRTHHHFENVSLQDPTSQSSQFDFASYQQTLLEADPTVGAVLDVVQSSQLAQEIIGQENLVSYQNAVDKGDIDEIHRHLERFREVADQVSELTSPEDVEEDNIDTDQQIEEWFDNITDDQLDDYVEGIQNINYTQEDYNWMDQVQSQVEDNSIHSDILAMGKSIATGRMDVNDAINAVCDKWGEAKATLAFFEIQRLYNGQ